MFFAIIWLVGCFGLNGPLRSISVYIGPFAREREKEKRNDRREKNVQTTPPAPTASAVSPCPTLFQISRLLRHWKFTHHHHTTRPSLSAINIIVKVHSVTLNMNKCLSLQISSEDAENYEKNVMDEYFKLAQELPTKKGTVRILVMFHNYIKYGPEVIKKIMLNSAEHGIINAHNYKNIKKFSICKVQKSRECCLFCS